MGFDEIAALLRIVRIVEEGDYDTVILDTAPTSHTMSLTASSSFQVRLNFDISINCGSCGERGRSRTEGDRSALGERA